MEVLVENVESALAQFYRINSTLQAEAHHWLMMLQNSSHAWSLVWELLQPNRTCEAQFFGSNTLYLKIVNNWAEVTEDEYETMKGNILQAIIAYSSGPKIVLNRLCSALAVFLLKVTPQYWKNSIEDIYNIFRPENLPNISQERSVWILLEVLSVIPNELSSVTLVHSQRIAVKEALKLAWPQVMVTLESLLDYNNSEIRSLAAKGVYTWVSLDNTVLPDCLGIAAKLVNVIQEAQASDPFEDCDHEIEALCQIMTNPSTHEYKRSILPGLEIILRTLPLLQKSKNQDFITNLYNLYILFGEAHGYILLEHLASNDSHSVEIIKTWLQSLLTCLSTPGSFPNDETYSHLMVSFWSTLHDDRNMLDEESKKIVSDILEPLYKEVCRILLYKSQYPPDGVTLTASEAELLRIYRQDIADTIVNCYLFIRKFLISLLENTLRNAKTWQEVESVLHLVHSLAETPWNCEEEDCDGIEGDENNVILSGMVDQEERKAVISLLVNVPPNLVNAQVVNSLNMAIGAYAEWWEYHSDMLSCLITTLVTSLQNPSTSTSATMALKDVTRECTTSIKPYVPALLNACQEALDHKRLREDECIRIMYSIGKLLSLIPYEDMVSKLEIIVNDYTTDIANALSQENNDSARDIIVMRLKMLANLCSSIYLNEKVNGDSPVMIILRRLLPLLRAITEHWSSSPVVTEQVCKCIKSSIITLIDDRSIPLVEEFVRLALSGYIVQPNTVMLELTKQLYIMFGKSPSHNQLLMNLIRSVSDTTMSLVMNNEGSSSADVVQVYFTLITAICKRNMAFLEATINLSGLFSFATSALTMPEGHTVSTAGQLLCMIISNSQHYQWAAQIVNTHGEHLVHTMLMCIGHDTSPRSVLNVFADIFIALNKMTPNLAHWLDLNLSRQNFPTEKADNASKKNFILLLLKERTSSKLLEHIKAFMFICRGVVQYQASTPSSND
ncbi:importin-13 [Cimex lectularius]|uniref:Importin-13 n=1 Tax=Cimex lectularius TaxID=79782 RepID=A0A8I6TI09_CIMLE|nr:importin-13 [Cimex lectularius]